jgi:hypothetical protein
MSSAFASVCSEKTDQYLLLSVDRKGDKAWMQHVLGCIYMYMCIYIYIDECKRCVEDSHWLLHYGLKEWGTLVSQKYVNLEKR